MSERAIISIRGVSKYFGEVRAVNDVSLDIRQGEFFSLLGPSGCGKTTLLRMLAGFEAPSSGEIHIDGQAMMAIPPNRRPVNMVFQNYAIFPHLDVRGNIAFGLRKAKLAKAELDRRVEETLAMIKLPGYGSRRGDELSGGERQRVALARALIKRPKVLLLDEPLGALDKKLREQMQVELRALQQQVGITFVFVTHDQEEALTMSDRIAVMSRGTVCEVEAPTRLYESPKTRFVADFIGTMNFFDGRVRDVAEGFATIDAGPLGEVRAPAEGSAIRSGADVVVALRPEKLKLAFEAPGESFNAVEGRIGTETYLGDRSHFSVYLPGREEPVAVATQNVERSDAESGGVEGPVWLVWSRESVILLASERDSPLAPG